MSVINVTIDTDQANGEIGIEIDDDEKSVRLANQYRVILLSRIPSNKLISRFAIPNLFANVRQSLMTSTSSLMIAFALSGVSIYSSHELSKIDKSDWLVLLLINKL